MARTRRFDGVENLKRHKICPRDFTVAVLQKPSSTVLFARFKQSEPGTAELRTGCR